MQGLLADPPELLVEEPTEPSRKSSWLAFAAAALILVVAMFPMLQAGFWAWDWYWIDEYAQGNTAWGGPFYDIARHANPLPVEVQWYRVTLAVLGLNPLAHHVLTLAGIIGTLAVLYFLLRRLGGGKAVSLWAVTLAGLAPASLTSWTWFAASPHMWAALLGLGAALAHVAWRQGGSVNRLLAVAAPVLTVLGLGMKNDAMIGPLLILAWEWSGSSRRPFRIAVTAGALLPMAAFVWWQSTAIDPHRDQAQTGLWQVLAKTVELLRFAFISRSEAELKAEFPPAAAAPVVLVIAGGLVGVVVLALAVVSLWTRHGRILVAVGIASLGPVAVLEPALLSRYVLPPVLLITAAAALGFAKLASARTLPWAVGALASLAVWGTLSHVASAGGVVATQEETALLQGLSAAGISPADQLAVRLAGSPLEPTTAGYRQFDPTLPPHLRLRKLRFLVPGEPVPAGMPLATATRRADGTYTVVIRQ